MLGITRALPATLALALGMALLAGSQHRATAEAAPDYMAMRPRTLGVPEDARPLDLGLDGIVHTMYTVRWGAEARRAVLATVLEWDPERREYDLGSLALLSPEMEVLRVYPAGEALRELYGFRTPPAFLAVTGQEEIVLLRQEEKDAIHHYTPPVLVLTAYCTETRTYRDLVDDIQTGERFSSYHLAGFTPPRYVTIPGRGYAGSREELRGLDVDELAARRREHILRIDIETLEEERIEYSLSELDPLELEASMFISQGHLSSTGPVAWYVLRRTSSPHEDTLEPGELRSAMHRNFVLVFNYEEGEVIDYVPNVDGFAMSLQEDDFLYSVRRPEQPLPWEPLSGALRILVQYSTGHILMEEYHMLNIAGYCSTRNRIYLSPDPPKIDTWETGEFFVRSLFDYTLGERPPHPNLYYYDF